MGERYLPGILGHGEQISIAHTYTGFLKLTAQPQTGTAPYRPTDIKAGCAHFERGLCPISKQEQAAHAFKAGCAHNQSRSGLCTPSKAVRTKKAQSHQCTTAHCQLTCAQCHRSIIPHVGLTWRPHSPATKHAVFTCHTANQHMRSVKGPPVPMWGQHGAHIHWQQRMLYSPTHCQPTCAQCQRSTSPHVGSTWRPYPLATKDAARTCTSPTERCAVSKVHQSPFGVSMAPTSSAAATPWRSPSTASELRRHWSPSREMATPGNAGKVKKRQQN
eukprot:1151445-Pelagomonas_calceolata.AAC.6